MVTITISNQAAGALAALLQCGPYALEQAKKRAAAFPMVGGDALARAIESALGGPGDAPDGAADAVEVERARAHATPEMFGRAAAGRGLDRTRHYVRSGRRMDNRDVGECEAAVATALVRVAHCSFESAVCALRRGAKR